MSLRGFAEWMNRLRTRQDPGAQPQAAEDSTGLAVAAIKAVFDSWQIGAERVQWVGDTSPSSLLAEGYGFDWWPGNFRVRVRVNGPHPELDFPLYRLNIQTDFLRGVDLTAPDLAIRLAALNRAFLPFAVVVHPESIKQMERPGRSLIDLGLDLKSAPVWLGSTAYIDEDTIEWLPLLFAGAGLLQPLEAELRAIRAAQLLGGEPNFSDLPRPSPAALNEISAVEEMFRSLGQQSNPWVGTGEFERIIKRWGRGGTGYGHADSAGLRMEMPFGHDTAVLRIRTDEPHRRWGNGLLMTLTLPFFDKDESAAAKLAIEMNFMEMMRWLKVASPLLGSWSTEDWSFAGSSGYAPAFNFFIPNAMYRPVLAERFVSYAMARARWFREQLWPDAVDRPLDEILQKRLARFERDQGPPR